MTLQEFYEKVGGDYADVMSRLPIEDKIRKFLAMFFEDENYSQIRPALEAKRWDDAFRNVHSLKGVALTMGLTRLGASSSALCEPLRGGAPTVDLTDLLAAVDRDYKEAADAYAELTAG